MSLCSPNKSIKLGLWINFHMCYFKRRVTVSDTSHFVVLWSNSAPYLASAVVEPQAENAGGSILKAVFKVSGQHFPSTLAFKLQSWKASSWFLFLMRDFLCFKAAELHNKISSVSDDFRIWLLTPGHQRTTKSGASSSCLLHCRLIIPVHPLAAVLQWELSCLHFLK